jgi:hypothetical protein
MITAFANAASVEFSLPADSLFGGYLITPKKQEEQFQLVIDTRQTDTESVTTDLTFKIPVAAVDFESVDVEGLNGYPYHWNIDWGDGTSLEEVSGEGDDSGFDFDAGTLTPRTAASHEYDEPGRYTITITPVDSQQSGWFRAFGVGISAFGEFPWTVADGDRRKIVSPLSPLTLAMFGNPDGTELSDAIGMGMFDGCDGKNFHLGDNFGLAPEWHTSVPLTFGFFFGAFQGSSLKTLPANFTFEHITNMGESGLMWTFKNCDSLVLPPGFRLPQLSESVLNQTGVFEETFATETDKTWDTPAGDAMVILNGNQPPTDPKGTFRTGDNTNGAERWGNFAGLNQNWISTSASTMSAGKMNFLENLKKAMNR